MNDTTATPDVAPVDELALLKTRAETLGITFHPNIGTDKLREKIKAKMEGTPEPKDDEAADDETTKVISEAQLRDNLRKEKMRLIRVRISCMNPAKAEIEGEIISVSNKFIGTVRRYIPFGEATDKGWHVPLCLLQQLKARKFQQVTTKKSQGKTMLPQSRWVNEFAIEELPQLTEQELKELSRKQAAAQGLG